MVNFVPMNFLLNSHNIRQQYLSSSGKFEISLKTFFKKPIFVSIFEIQFLIALGLGWLIEDL